MLIDYIMINKTEVPLRGLRNGMEEEDDEEKERQEKINEKFFYENYFYLFYVLINDRID